MFRQDRCRDRRRCPGSEVTAVCRLSRRRTHGPLPRRPQEADARGSRGSRHRHRCVCSCCRAETAQADSRWLRVSRHRRSVLPARCGPPAGTARRSPGSPWFPARAASRTAQSPRFVNDVASGRIADGAIGNAPPGCRDGCDTRPTCQSCGKIRPPRACTANVIGRHPCT